MFDPTIFDNLKVVVEGIVYDLDLDGTISITNRNDLINLATMSREYSVSFRAYENSPLTSSTLKLEAHSKDLYGEILEEDELSEIGCTLTLIIKSPLGDLERTPMTIEEKLGALWEHRPTIHQCINFDWKKEKDFIYFNEISLVFDRKINEDQISDIPEMIKLLLKSMKIVEEIT